MIPGDYRDLRRAISKPRASGDDPGAKLGAELRAQ